MGLVISSFTRCLGVEEKKDGVGNRSLISHEQGLSYYVNIYSHNDCDSDPILGEAIATVNEKQLIDMPCFDQPCSGPDLHHDNLHSSVEDNSSMSCLDQAIETGSNALEIKNVIMSEVKPTKRAKHALRGEVVDTTKAGFVNGCDLKRAVTCNEIILNERRIGPYTSSQKLLLVGEGDFSFSASLACAFISAANIIATSLDSHEFLSKNYSHAMLNILKSTERGATVLHGVDCTKMENLFSSISFDRVIYNFPHAGFRGRDENCNSQLHRHRTLVRLFLTNAKRLLKNKGGEIHITHKSNGFFLDWDIKSLASNEGLLLLEEVPFNHYNYPGYHTMCGFGGNKFFKCYPCKTYKFGLPHSFQICKF